MKQNKYAKNQVELSHAMDCNRRTITRYRKNPEFPKPRSDGSWEIAPCIAFMEKRRAELDKPEQMTARQRKEEALAKIYEMRILKERGELLPLKEAQDTIVKAIVSARRRFLNIPQRIAERLTLMTDAIAIRELLVSEVHAALRDISEHEFDQVKCSKCGSIVTAKYNDENCGIADS